MNNANLDKLYRLAKLTGGKYIIVEDGEPQAVLMDFKEFEDLAEPRYLEDLTVRFENLAEEVNKKISEAQISEVVADDLELPDSEKEYSENGEDITIEPLT